MEAASQEGCATSPALISNGYHERPTPTLMALHSGAPFRIRARKEERVTSQREERGWIDNTRRPPGLLGHKGCLAKPSGLVLTASTNFAERTCLRLLRGYLLFNTKPTLD
jgi:hypothetical protein